MKKNQDISLPNLKFWILFILIGFILESGCRTQPECEPPPFTDPENSGVLTAKNQDPAAVKISRDISLREYYKFMDGVVAHFDTLLDYPINEHFIVHANPWIIERLENTDYYRMMDRGKFVYDPQAQTILYQGDSLVIPSSYDVMVFDHKLHNTIIDINIPEFILRIMEYDKELHAFPVRVGRDERKYLELAKATVDLRTRPGKGEIVRINRNPRFINPSNAKEYKVTRRDDGKVTLLPNIPWLEPEINGQRFGQLIHPTTNPETLGKAYSNGCIGTSEAAAWRIYYHAPMGTRVQIRYDLEIENEKGEKITLDNIYPGIEKLITKEKKEPIAEAGWYPPHSLLASCSADCITVWDGIGESFQIGER